MLQGLCTFPGINSIVEATISFVHGISPSIARLTIKPQLGFIGEGGTLRFAFGDTVIEFPDCKVDYNSLQRTRSGEIWRLSIFDRRWKWKFGAIGGLYNVKEANGLIKDGTEKTPHELATLCFQAINEVNFDLAGLPNEPRPQVDWDFDLPMEALARLCDELGCRIALGLDNKVRIVKVGEGANLPEDGILENSLTINPPEKPDAAVIVCGKTRYQCDFLLRAVGRETDDTIVAIDDLSYKPASGWTDIISHQNVFAEFGKTAWDLARESVFRWYQVDLTGNGVHIPGYSQLYGNITSFDRIEFEDEQVATTIENGIRRNLPLWVYGSYFAWLNDEDGNNVTTTTPPTTRDDSQIYTGPFVFDRKLGLVKFSEPVARNTGTSGDSHDYAAATLRLRTACTIRDKNTLAWKRYGVVCQLGGQFATAWRFVIHDEIILNVEPVYTNNYAINFFRDNLIQVNEECNHYLDGIQQEYQQTLPQTITYAGLRRIELDGAIQQIILSVGPGGATTMVARNNEILHRTLPYKERRRIERAKFLEQFIQKERRRILGK